MLDIKENYLLSQLTTFHIGGPAQYFVEVADAEALKEALDFARRKNLPVLILGGGSNVLVSDAGFKGVVIDLVNKGLELRDQGDEVFLNIASGELWDDVVAFAVKNNLWGIENLSHIPGKAGGFAVQNVGAYGQEAAQVVQSVQALDLQSGGIKIFSNSECGFEYRKSIFNSSLKGRFAILQTVLKLSKVPQPNLSYPDLKRTFENSPNPKLAEIRAVVEKIRDTKFPYPYYPNAKGSAGSFFKNSILNQQQYQDLEKQIAANIPAALEKLREIKNKFPQSAGIKIPTAFIFQICGIKGMAVGDAKINETQPLVILNDSNATAADVLELSKQVRAIVKQKTGLSINIEPEFVGFNEQELSML